MIRAETAAASLNDAGETVSDGLLIAMIIKGLSTEYRTFSTVVTQRESPMNFIDFKTALRNFEETEKCQQPHTEGAAQDSVMRANQKEPRSRDNNLCYACGRPGHKAYECKNKGYKRKRW